MKKIGISFAILAFAAFGLPYSYAIAQPIGAEENAKEFATRTLVKIDALETQLRDLTNIVERLDKDLAAQKAENQRLAKIIDENSAKLSQLTNDKPIKEEIAPKTDEKKPDEKKPDESAPVNPPIVEKTEVKEEKPLTPPIVTPTPTPTPAPAPIIAPPPPPPPPPPVAKVLTAPELLASAKLSIQNSEYERAKGNLKTLIDNHGKTTEGIEALWLNGELSFMSKDWLGAAQNYVAYLKIAPNGPRVSDVLIRLASSYREMGDNRQRCLALNAYTERTPNPNAIQKSRASDEFAKGACPKPNAK